ncbi:MAG: TIGR01212 family radical SAM protein [Paludibacteraceae bacterium]|nr:TIGR01212 family radical SAM protein [Paludibacteraceae bacterium]
MERLKRYNDYASYLKALFPHRMQKITIHAGFSCPNRDGKVEYGGCTYCNNQTFNPDYCTPDKSITQQLTEGIDFFRKKYPDQRYLAYFQAYTNTYGSFETLRQKYEEALSHPLVEGLVIGTRPDCVDNQLLDYLQELRQSHYIMIEYGVESTLDRTLDLINRGHSYAVAEKAIRETAQRNIETCVHLILGLPQEDENEILSHADKISTLPIRCIKLHQLQLIKGTKMAQQYQEHPEWFHLYSADEYINLLVRFIERLNPDFVIERFISQSPKELLLNNGWNLKNYEFTDKLEKRMNELNIIQGKHFQIRKI